MAQSASNSGSSSIPITELFWSLLDKADRKFSRVRDLPNYGRNRNDADFHKAFKIYTQLWKLQQEHRQKLVEAGLRRWEVGEIAARIAQLYYGQYQRTSDSSYLSEAYIFYEAILGREYFRDGGQPQDTALANKQLRFLARFLLVCLVLGRREMVSKLVGLLKSMVDECKKAFQETEIKEWKHVVQEIVRFLKVDTNFMNLKPLRYSFLYDAHPDSLPIINSGYTKRGLVLRDVVLSSYHQNEVKFTELTLDSFRMLQCLEWEPSGSFSTSSAENSHFGSGTNRVNLLQDIRDQTLPPNPRKFILYRPSATHFLVVLATICEELPPDGIMLIYLSAAGGPGSNNLVPVSPSSESSLDAAEKISGNFSNLEFTSPLRSPRGIPTHPSFQHKSDQKVGDRQACLWFGSRGSGGLNFVCPVDLIPFTRKPMFMVIDSDKSQAFKIIHGAEKGETAAMLLSPSCRPPPSAATSEFARAQHGSQFTMFLTAPVQAFCTLVGIPSMNIDRDKYDNAEKLLSSSFSEWEKGLVTSNGLHPVWVEVLGDPFLRRLLLRFIFCRAVLALYVPTRHQEEFLPDCRPQLPESISPDSTLSRSAITQFASLFGVTSQFLPSEGIASFEPCFDESAATTPSEPDGSCSSETNGCSC